MSDSLTLSDSLVPKVTVRSLSDCLVTERLFGHRVTIWSLSDLLVIERLQSMKTLNSQPVICLQSDVSPAK